MAIISLTNAVLNMRLGQRDILQINGEGTLQEERESIWPAVRDGVLPNNYDTILLPLLNNGLNLESSETSLLNYPYVLKSISTWALSDNRQPEPRLAFYNNAASSETMGIWYGRETGSDYINRSGFPYFAVYVQWDGNTKVSAQLFVLFSTKTSNEAGSSWARGGYYEDHFGYIDPFSDPVDFDLLTSGTVIFDTVRTDDPYDDGGGSTTGGGAGNFDNSSDPIGIPGLPSISAADTGFITLFVPTLSQLNALASYMWGNAFDISTWKKVFADPMDAILGLSIVPVSVPSAGAAPVIVGNISTGVALNKASAQYVAVDCGSISMPEYWQSFMDYDPYTKIEIFLPYIGMRPLKADDVMGTTLHVVYHVDILSGACAAYVAVNGNVLYTYIGQCSSSIPVSGNDWTNVINGVLGAAMAGGAGGVSGGLAAGLGLAGASLANNVTTMKPTIERGGSMAGTGGLMGGQTPYVIITRPRQCKPADQNQFTGYPSYITTVLNTLHGFTQIEEIHLDGIPATSDELNEIERLLKDGVLI